MESWAKFYCPACEKANWVCYGDLEDCTVFDPEALECHSCSKKWMIVEPHECCWYDDEDEDHKANPTNHAYVEKGLGAPS